MDSQNYIVNFVNKNFTDHHGKLPEDVKKFQDKIKTGANDEIFKKEPKTVWKPVTKEVKLWPHRGNFYLNLEVLDSSWSGFISQQT